MRTLIVYYSFTQNNEKLAKYLETMLNCDIVRIETVKRRSGLSIMLDLMFNRNPAIKAIANSLRDYDRVIFVAPIWAGRIATPLKTFLAKEKSNIRRYSFATVCGGTPGQKEKIENELHSIVNVKPENVVELWINNLLPAGKKDTIKYTSGYRIETADFLIFQKELQPLINPDQDTHLTNVRLLPSVSDS